MALNSADIPVISYYNASGSLTLALCNTITCALPVKRILDNFGTSGSYNSLALTSADVPIVSYHDDENENLKLAVCADIACTTNTVSIIASTGIVGWYPSLVITAANVPIISYFDLETLDLKLAVCNNTACTSPTRTTLDSEGSVGLSPSMALTTTDLPIITYQGNGSLKIALCDVTACTSPTISILDSSGFTGRFTSLALTAENRPIISYTENTYGSLRYILGAVTIDRGQPDSFTKSAPNNTTTITSSSIALSWTASVGATSYEYCVALLTMPCTTWNSTGTSTSHTVTALVPGTTYQWQVRANNDAGTTLANTSIPWQFKVQNAASNVYGTASSMKVTSTGTAVIAYNEDNNRDLKFAICESLICANPTVRTIATANTVGDSISMSLTSADIPLIAFSEYSLDRTIFSVKLAVCNDTACTNPTISTINTGASAGAYVSMALNSADIPVISYYDSGGSLTLALCNTITCALPVKRILDNFGTSGSYNSLALTSADVPIVSYHDDDEENLKLAVCADIACATNTVSTIARTGIVGWYPSLVITAANVPIISYFDLETLDLKLAVCNNTACTSPTRTTLDSEGSVGLSPSMALTTTDLPIITYQGNGSLKIALCDVTACTSPTISILDSSGFTGRFTSLALTAENRPIISYTENTYGSLRYILGAVTIDRGLPNSFVITAPGTTTITSSSVVLAWTAAIGATSYEYCIALSVAACTTWKSTGTATAQTVTDLVHGATCYWQVRAHNDVGTTLASSSGFWRFTVTLPPTSFAKTAPANNATNQKTSLSLSWAASTRATSYEYCIALTTATCTNWKSTGSARTATVTGLTKNKAYYWQVRAKNLGGTTLSTSTFWKFTTAK